MARWAWNICGIMHASPKESAISRPISFTPALKWWYSALSLCHRSYFSGPLDKLTNVPRVTQPCHCHEFIMRNVSQCTDRLSSRVGNCFTFSLEHKYTMYYIYYVRRHTEQKTFKKRCCISLSYNYINTTTDYTSSRVEDPSVHLLLLICGGAPAPNAGWWWCFLCQTDWFLMQEKRNTLQ